MTLFQARGISEEFRIHRASPTLRLAYLTTTSPAYTSSKASQQGLAGGRVPEGVLRNSDDMTS